MLIEKVLEDREGERPIVVHPCDIMQLGLNDASSEARAVARISFGHFNKIFPDQAERCDGC